MSRQPARGGSSPMFAGALFRALLGETDKDALLLGDAGGYEGPDALARIARGDWFDAPEEAVRGTGYVVESLEAALWCFRHADSFEAAVLRAANLGGTDQTAGQFGATPLAWSEPHDDGRGPREARWSRASGGSVVMIRERRF